MGPESGRPALESVGQKEAPQKTKKRKTAKRRKKPATAKKGSGADAAASGDSAASRGRETSGAPARSDDSRGTGGTKEAVQELAVKVPAKKTRRGKRGGKKHKRTQKERSAPQQEQPSGTTVKEKPPADKPSEAPSPAKEQQVKVDSPAGETKSTTEKRPARRRTRRKGQRSAATAKAPEREAEEGERVVPTGKVSVEKTSRGQAPAERPAAEKASDREAEDGGPDEARDDHAAARSKLVLKKRPRRRARGSKAHKSAAEEDESK